MSNFNTDYELEFMSLQKTCDLGLLYVNLIPIPKSHTMHFMNYNIMSEYSC